VFRFFAGLIALACLAGCAGTAPRGGAPAAPAGAIQGQGFALEGRISVHYGEDSLSGKFAWNHTEQSDELSLASPLGNQLAQIVRDNAGVTLTNSNRQQFHARDVESLTEARLGWRLPLAGLTDWVRGRPQGKAAEIERDTGGRISRMKENGWLIEYGYEGENKQPQRLFLNYTRAEKPLDIRLAIDTRG